MNDTEIEIVSLVARCTKKVVRDFVTGEEEPGPRIVEAIVAAATSIGAELPDPAERERKRIAAALAELASRAGPWVARRRAKRLAEEEAKRLAEDESK